MHLLMIIGTAILAKKLGIALPVPCIDSMSISEAQTPDASSAARRTLCMKRHGSSHP
jgi:hypothetical protein